MANIIDKITIYSSGGDIMTKKKEICELSIANLDLQSDYCKLNMKLQYHNLKIASKKKELIAELTTVYTGQITEVTAAGQERIKMICDFINELDVPSQSIIDDMQNIEIYMSKMNDNIKKICEIEQTIPQTASIDIYKATVARQTSCGI